MKYVTMVATVYYRYGSDAAFNVGAGVPLLGWVASLVSTKIIR